MPQNLTGPAAIAAIQKQVSPKGVAAAEARARKAIEKKYPGIYMPEKRVAKSADEARMRNAKRFK
jgi:hypothetical protein